MIDQACIAFLAASAMRGCRAFLRSDNFSACHACKSITSPLQLQCPPVAGDGFVTNQAVIAQSGVSDATAFFNDLLTKPYVQQFIVGPHIYCADVSGSSYATSGQALYSKLSTTFGYLNLKGRQIFKCEL